MAIFIYDEKNRKMVEVKKPPVRTNDTRNYINMRKSKWSGQTKVEFSETTMDKDIADRNKR